MRDFLMNPAWQEEDVGEPIPDSLHACSVALPTWDSILSYEKGHAKVVNRMKSGYPRFFKHPLIQRLNAEAKAELAEGDEEVLVFSNKQVVQRAQRWIEKQANAAVRVASYHGLQAIIYPLSLKEVVHYYWRFTGEVVSSRQAEDFLNGKMQEGSKSAELAQALAGVCHAPAEDLFIFSSGMAAMVAAYRAVIGQREGKKTLQIEFPYVDCLKVQEQFGNGAVYLNHAGGEAYDEAILRIKRGEFAAVFTETPSNPLLKMVDIIELSEACAEGNTPLIVDDSVSGAFNLHVLPYVDMVTSSLTKWVSGAGDVMAGMVTLRADSPHAPYLRQALEEDSTIHAPLYVRDAEVLIKNRQGYEERAELINRNAFELAQWLNTHPAVSQVWYPALNHQANYDAVKTSQGGYGGLISFVLKQVKKTPNFYDGLKVSKGPSFGTPFTLVSPYTLLAHYHELEWAEDCGVPSHLIRVSVGLEPIQHLKEMFTNAFTEA